MHKPVLSLLLGVAACAAAGASLAQDARAPHKRFPLAPPPPWVSPETPQGSGAFPAVMQADPGLATHVVYRPANLAALGSEKLPVVAFANGGCVNVGNRFRYFLTEIASHGFIAIATGTMAPKEAESALSSGDNRNPPAPGSPAARNEPPVAGSKGASPTTPRQMLDAVDWAIAENGRKGSPYEGRIDTGKIAVMGQSCGGLQAIDAARDPRVTTFGVWNSGTFPKDGFAYGIAAARADKADLEKLRIPALYVSGEPADVAFVNAQDDFERLQGPAFWAWREQTGHAGTYREPNGGVFARVAVDWLRWQLKGDQQAARQFVGADCGLCSKTEWHVKSKGLALDNGKAVSQ
ncbi:alpha/beta hydrolase [Telluria beijingensis]|uniref:alpha/beta hydrolase n=1 Tax=Telluria beijingensis TaxID=3068633 RepID=UPI00279523F7|nr:alpha/beta hydrolase [Massilia sp. REN29]